jgi:ACS family tartrate transporter-like MFS transporter
LNVGILGPVTVSEFLPPALPTALTDFQQLALSALPRIAMAPTHAGALPSRAPPRARNPMPARITVQGAPIDVAHEDTPLARATTARVSLRLLPFLFVLYMFNFLDRTNVSIAALQMNRDLQFSVAAFGLGSGIFFVGYALFEIPSNLLLARVGARWWIARIMFTWGVIAVGMALVRTPIQFYVLRFLLGVAEAGFFPGVVYYLSQWFPSDVRARASARFMVAIPLSGVLGGAIGGSLLALDGRLGLAGWQWLFIAEGLPSILLGVAVLMLLTDRPADARWLTLEQRTWLEARLARDGTASSARHGVSALRSLVDPLVWLVSLPYFASAVAYYGYQFWGPTIIRDALRTSDTATSLVSGLIALVAAAVMLMNAAHSDRTNERFVHAARGSAVLTLGFLGVALLPWPIAKVLAIALVPIGAMMFMVPYWCLPPMLFRGAAMAATIALINSIQSLGGFVGPNIIGVAKTLTGGTTGAFLVLTSFGFLSGASLLLLRRRPAFRAPTIIVPLASPPYAGAHSEPA